MDFFRSITVTGEFPPGALVFESMTAQESIGRPFEYDVELLAETPDLDLSSFIGKPMTVHLEIPHAAPRHFNGIVCRFSLTAAGQRMARYGQRCGPGSGCSRKRPIAASFKT